MENCSITATKLQFTLPVIVKQIAQHQVPVLATITITLPAFFIRLLYPAQMVTLRDFTTTGFTQRQ